MQNTDYFKSDLTRLHNLGVNLINAMQVEQFPAEMKAHFTNTLKKDFTAFKQDLPVFSHSYQGLVFESAAPDPPVSAGPTGRLRLHY